MEGWKQTEIGLMPNEWKVGRIDKFFTIQQGKQVSKRNRIGENQKPFLRTKNVFWGRLVLEDLDEMHFTRDEEIKFQLKKGDLLVCEGGSVGRTAILNNSLNNCYYQNHLHRVRRLSDETNPEFACFWLEYAFEYGKIYFGRANETTLSNLSKSRLAELNIPHPPLPEQRKIAYVLGIVQKAIEKQDQLIKTTTELKKALMQKLFTEGLYGESQKMTEIGLVPESWEVVELIQVCKKPHYGFTDSAAKSGNAQFLRITDISEYGVNWKKVPYCQCSDLERYELKNGDIVFARIGATTGKSYLIEDPPVSVYASYLIRVRCKDEVIPRFLIYYFETEQYWHQINARKGDNLKGGVNGSVLSKLFVPKPDIEEQKEVAKFFKTLDWKIASALSKKQTLTDLFKTLLHELMTGERRVHELEFEGMVKENALQEQPLSLAAEPEVK